MAHEYQVGDFVQVKGGWKPGVIVAVHKISGRINGYKVHIPSTGQRLNVKPEDLE